MNNYIITLFVFIALKSMSGLALPVDAEFLEPPQNQYVLEGTKATISCYVRSQTAYWIINGTAIFLNYHTEQARYEAMRVVFTNTSNGMNHTLTMVVPSYLNSIVKNVSCVGRDASHRQIESVPVNIFVLKTFRPDPPLLTVDSIYHPSMAPQLTVTITGQPLWPGYEISEYTVDIINGSDDSLLYNLTVPNNSSQDNTVAVNINQTFLQATAEQCYSLKVSTSAGSPSHGFSEPTLVETAVFRAPGVISDQAVSLSTLFNSNGALSHVNVKVQLPEVCSSQPVNFTITIEDVSISESADVVRSGPHSHLGTGVVSQDISGLQNDHTYMVQVQVDSLTGSVVSTKRDFNTAADFGSYTNPTGGLTGRTSDITIYIAAMGISIGAALVMLIAFGISLACLCVKGQKTKVYGPGENIRNGSRSSMVTNPIYAGPVYDMIDPRFESLAKPSSPQLSIPLSPMSPLSDDSMGHDEHSHLTVASCSANGKPKTRNVYTLPGDLRSPAAEKLALKKNGLERNKRHLTLPMEGRSNGFIEGMSNGFIEGMSSGFGQRSEMKEEETYVEMSTKGTPTPSPN